MNNDPKFEALRESEMKFRTLASLAPVGMFLSDAQGRAVYVNECWCAVAGLTAAEALGQGWLRALHPEDRARVIGGWDEAVNRKASSAAEFRFQRPDGSVVWVQGQAVEHRSAEGKLLGYIGTVTDVTERRQAEEALRKRNERAQLLSETLGQLLNAQDPDTIVRELFPKVATHLGVELYLNYMVNAQGTGLQLHSSEGIPDAHRAAFQQLEFGQAICGTVAQTCAPIVANDIQNSSYEKAGLLRAMGVQTYACNPLMAGGQLLGTLSFASRRRTAFEPDELEFIRTISQYCAAALDRLQTTRALAKSTERLRLATQTGKVGVWDWDIWSNRVTWSESLYAIHGVRRDEFPATVEGFAALIHPDDRERVAAAIRRTLEEDAPYELEFRAVRPEGKIIWLFTNATVTREQGRAVRLSGATLDITGRKEAEDGLAAVTANLERERRLYETVLSNTPDFVYVFSLDYRFIYANQALRTMFGKKWDESPNKTFLEIGYEPWHAEMHSREIDQVAATRGPVRGEVPFHGTHGRRIYEYIFVPVFGVNGEVEAVAGTTRDMTDRKATETALAERSKTLEALNHVGNTLVAERELQKIVQSVTDAGAEICGAQFGAFFYNSHVPEGVPSLFTSCGAARAMLEQLAQPGHPLGLSGGFKNLALRREADLDLRLEAPASGAAEPVLRSYLAVPVVSRGGEVLGGLIYGHETADVFTPKAGELIAALAAQAAIAIDNANLYQALQRELEEHRRSEDQLWNQKEVLEQMVRGASLPEILETLTSGFERLAQRPAIASIMLTQTGGRHLLCVAGRNLPAAWARFADGLEIGPQNGACGTAAFRRERVVTVDILADPLWAEFKEEASKHGLRACWSMPILSSEGRVLGTFAVYYREPTVPDAHELGMGDIMARTAAIAIERQQAERTLAQLAAIVESSQDAIISKDLNGVVQTWNDGAEQIFGYTAEQMIGRPVNVLIPADRLNEEAAILKRLRRGERVEPFETLRLRRDGTAVEISLSISPIRDKNDKIIGASKIGRDITAQKQFEAALQRARDEALAASRAKDDFLAALSHELRTPLNPVLLLSSEGAEDAALPPTVRAQFATIRNNVELEARLIDDLLDLTRITRGKLALENATLDLHAVLRDALNTVQMELEAKHLQVALELAAPAPFVKGDAVRLRQVFWNVFKNAVKFTPEHGHMTVTSRTDLATEALLITVTDTGIGMTADELTRVFTAFSQGEHAREGASRFGGLGLGLAISRMLVELHGGTIEAASAGRDLGACFTVRLPRVAAPEPATAGGAGRPIEPDLARLERIRGLRLLLVEDHEPTRTALAHLLQRRGYQVQTAASVAEARTRAAQSPVDFLISDIGLPDGSGYDLMKELHAQYGLEGIALTGYGMEYDVARSHDAGFLAHLTKPVRVQSLETVLATTLLKDEAGI